MTNYIIYFNQQWVGDHPADWYESRGPLTRDNFCFISDLLF